MTRGWGVKSLAASVLAQLLLTLIGHVDDRPTRLFIIGNVGLELRPDCVVERIRLQEAM